MSHFQYYLKPGFLHLSVNATPAEVEAWRQAGNLSAPVDASAGGEILPGVWQGQSYANSSDALLVARLDIPNGDFNRLHMRAIDVSVCETFFYIDQAQLVTSLKQLLPRHRLNWYNNQSQSGPAP